MTDLRTIVLENQGDRDDILGDVKEFVTSDIQKKLWTISKRIIERQKKALLTPSDKYNSIDWKELENDYHSFMSEELLKNYSKDYE